MITQQDLKDEHYLAKIDEELELGRRDIEQMRRTFERIKVELKVHSDRTFVISHLTKELATPPST